MKPTLIMILGSRSRSLHGMDLRPARKPGFVDLGINGPGRCECSDA